MQTLPEGDPLKFGVMIHLSPEELKFLAGVMAHIKGDPETSRRRHADTIMDELRKLGIPWRAEDLTGSIDCRNKGA